MACHDDRYSLIMEYVDGRDLSLLIERLIKPNAAGLVRAQTEF